jgi:hypothetical protein
VTAGDDRFRELAQFLAGRLARDDDGKTFLLGHEPGAWTFAVAAGVRGHEDHPRFLEFARYLVHHRFGCDSYALLWPATIDGEPVYVAELAAADATSARVIDRRGECLPHPGGDCMIDAITPPTVPLPGIKRRDLDRLFAELQVPL